MVISSLGVGACRDKSKTTAPAPSAAPSASAAAPATLTPEQAARVLAKVGDRTITLGDYAAALERMDSFERSRYQSAERRRLLLNEMVDLELLAQEARRRGLDKQPETEERLRQMLRDELLRDARKEVANPNDIPEAEVRAYYEQHKDEFDDPERRRVAHIALTNQAEAKKVLALALKATPAEWGKLVTENSTDKGPRGLGSSPPELAGNLGIVGPPGHARGASTLVPEPVRAAVFKIEQDSGVYPELVQDGSTFHIVRLASRSPARTRTYEEAQRSIRVTLAQQASRQRELQLEQDMRAKFPVTIDQAALAKVSLPKTGAPAPAGKAKQP